MQRLFQLAALALAIAIVTFFACRAQPSSHAPDRTTVTPPATRATDAGPDAPAPKAHPEVYLPASKSGGVFLEHQQAPQ